ncbi:hypothetical protein AAMO2058_001572200, partial [Amorphochlora amoebiformis]
MEGWLEKKSTNCTKSFQSRYFKLVKSSGTYSIQYFHTKGAENHRFSCTLKGAKVRTSDSNDTVFFLDTNAREFEIRTESATVCKNWIAKLKMAIDESSGKRKENKKVNKTSASPSAKKRPAKKPKDEALIKAENTDWEEEPVSSLLTMYAGKNVKVTLHRMIVLLLTAEESKELDQYKEAFFMVLPYFTK